MARKNFKSPCVFLDRDGTLIHDNNYLSSPEQVKLYSYSAAAINKLHKAGFKVIVTTNQSGIARGKFALKTLSLIHKRFFSLLKEQGSKIDGLYFCPHIDEDKCNCRKPKIGMVLQAAREHNIDLKNSFVVGDILRDYMTGVNMGGKGILLLSGHGKKQVKLLKKEKTKPFAICRNLLTAANLIIKTMTGDDFA
ncbi:MAG: HAD family hydrolase [Elusimicrobiota bacterium]|jgi:histidinol-phosphate phosphatase family protein|nr:HAD family hydrolase [Elusimicrobiota bacterium]